MSHTHRNPQPKYKFLLRNIVLDTNRDRVLAKVRCKKLYLREIQDQAFHTHKVRKIDRKRLKLLTSVKFFTGFIPLTTPYCLNFFNSAQNLRKFIYNAALNSRVENSLCYFRRLCKNIQVIDLDGSELTVEAVHLPPFYRTISSKINLKIFRRSFEYTNESQGTVEKEYPMINQYIIRLRKLLAFNYGQSDLNQRSFQKVLKQEQPSQCVTDLSLVIDARKFQHGDGIGRILYIEGSEAASLVLDNESEGNTLIYEDEFSTSHETKPNNQDLSNIDAMSLQEDGKAPIKDEIVPFFRFDLFPNLKRLQIMFAESNKCSLGPFVVQGCTYLKKLEQITIILENRPPGIKYLFEGLLCLPPILTSFSLEISYIRQEESDQLTQFFKHQTQLISLSLSLSRQGNASAKHENLGRCLMNVWQYLEDKPDLKYFKLNSICTPIENISDGLGRATTVQQLKEFEISACDLVNSQVPPMSRVEGLCEFLDRQRHTLHRLKISLNYVIDADILNSISKVIAGMKELTELELCVNCMEDDDESDEDSSEGSDMEVSDHNNDELKSLHFNEFYVQLRRTLQVLPKLTNLILEINPISKAEEVFISESLKIFNVLPTIKTLKTVCLKLPFDKSNEDAKASIATALSELKNVTSVDVKTSCETKTVGIQKVVNEINKRQAMRCDLMF